MDLGSDHLVIQLVINMKLKSPDTEINEEITENIRTNSPKSKTKFQVE